MENEIIEQVNALEAGIEKEQNIIPSMPFEESHSSPIQEVITPSLKDGDELLELSDSFDINDFQVVRREFFAHQREPAITFNECKFGVNAACLSKFPDYQYAQVLVNPTKHILALRPCTEIGRDSYQWCGINSKGKRNAKAITCKLFFAKIMNLMGWNPKYRYKILGKLIHAKGEYMLAFDLTSTEVYKRLSADGEPVKMSRTAIYPADWQHQFGLPFNEHKQSLQISVFDGYAVYAIREPAKQAIAIEETQSALIPAATNGGVVNE